MRPPLPAPGPSPPLPHLCFLVSSLSSPVLCSPDPPFFFNCSLDPVPPLGPSLGSLLPLLSLSPRSCHFHLSPSLSFLPNSFSLLSFSLPSLQASVTTVSHLSFVPFHFFTCIFPYVSAFACTLFACTLLLPPSRLTHPRSCVTCVTNRLPSFPALPTCPHLTGPSCLHFLTCSFSPLRRCGSAPWPWRLSWP